VPRTLLTLILIGTVGACATSLARRGELPPAVTEAVTPSAAAAEWYMSPPPRTPVDGDPVRRLLADEVVRAAAAGGLPVPERDGRLDHAADDLARVTPENRQLSFDLVAFLLGHYGIVEPEPNLLFARGGPHAEEAMVELLRPQVATVLARQPHSRLGIGVFRSDELAVVLAFQEQHLELRPVPRSLAPGLVAQIAGRLLHGFRFPKVIVTGPGGDVSEVRVSETRGRFQATFSCRRDRTGVYQLEIAAEADRGPAVLANFPLYCGISPPDRSPPVPVEMARPQDPVQAEEEMLGLINGERTARGLSPLRLDRQLTAVARSHSAEMAATGVVGHLSPRTGNAADRVKKMGLNPLLVAENVGRAYSAGQAHRGFMGSPGHRANVLEPRVTAVGIGIVAGREENGTVPLFFTQLFTEGL
jgi:uncharacterized protein YkwD